MNGLQKAILIVTAMVIAVPLIYILYKWSKGENVSLDSIYSDLKNALGIKENAPPKAGETPSAPSVVTTPAQTSAQEQNTLSGKTVTETNNNQGKLILAATVGGAAAFVGTTAIPKVVNTIAKAGKTAVSAAAKMISMIPEAAKTATIATTGAKVTVAGKTALALAGDAAKATGITAFLGKTGIAAGAKTGAKLLGKIALPLTIAMAAYDTAALAKEREEKGSLTVGEIVGQYSGLRGLGITRKLPQGIQDFLGRAV